MGTEKRVRIEIHGVAFLDVRSSPRDGAEIRDSLTTGCLNRRVSALIVPMPLTPVPIDDRRNRRGGNRQKHARDAAQLSPREHRENDRQWMQVDAPAYEARINRVVLDEPEDPENTDRPDRQHRRMQRTDGGRHGREHERADQRNKFEHSRQHTEHHGIRNAEYGEPRTAENADEDAGRSCARV